mgnify:CR=1 FL=1
MKLNLKISFSNINPWKILRFVYKIFLLTGVLSVIAVFIFLYIYFYQPVTEARITVTLTYDAIYQKINKVLFDKISKKLDERKLTPLDSGQVRNPFESIEPLP